jgi:hypothetical protein
MLGGVLSERWCFKLHGVSKNLDVESLNELADVRVSFRIRDIIRAGG